MGASPATGRGPRATVDLAARSRWSARCDVSLGWVRGPGRAECCVAPALSAWPGRAAAASTRVLHSRTRPHNQAHREAGCSPHRPSPSVAEARSPRYPRQTSTSVVSNKTDRPQKPAIPRICPSHKNDQQDPTWRSRRGPAGRSWRGDPARRSRPRSRSRGNRVCAGRMASTIGHSSPHDPSRHPDGGRLVGYRSAVRQAAIVATTQPATIVTAYVTHQTQIASMTNSSRYVR